MSNYTVVHQDSLVGFEYAVNHLLETGWKTVGGVSMVSTGVGTFSYAQAMVRLP